GAAYFASSRRGQRDDGASLIASGTLGLTLAAGIFIVFAAPEDPVSQIYRLSVPTVTIALCLLMSLLFWQSGYGWVRLLSSDRPASRLLRILLPSVLVLPLVPSLLELGLSQSNLLSPIGLRLVVLVLNILLIGAVAYWAVKRVGSDRAALIDSLTALQESRQRLETAASAGQLGVFEWDVASRKFTWSKGSEERLGLNPGSIPTSDAWTALVEPEDVARVTAEMQRLVAQRAPRCSYRSRFLRPNGEVRVLEGSSLLFYDEAGALVRTVGVLVNVTEREAREAALTAREAQLSSILETVPDAMVVVDEDGVIRQFSAAAEALWGYRTDEVIGRDYRMLATPEQFAPNSTKLAEYVADQRGRTIETILGGGQAKDGRLFPLELRIGLTRVEGRLLLTIFARDITERLAGEERLSELNTELAHVSRLSAMSELASDLAHELNQPLNASTNFMAAARMLIERGADGERISELLAMASEQTLRAGEIIRRLRAFMARGDVDIGIESVEQTVREAVGLVLVGAGQFHIRIAYDFDPTADMVLADRIQIQQVVVNLLRNAVDALRNADVAVRQISISSRSIDGNMVAIEIADTGPGMPDDVLNKLFTRFTTTKGERDGMGIGLSISRRIIESHGGELSARNRREGGAAFCFTLPGAEEGEGHE
ncbi:MAG: PAS domain S-box protein, partial [Sphingomonadales bacterium]